MIQRTRTSASFAASWAFLAVAFIAVAAACAIAGGEAGHSQLGLATAYTESLLGLEDGCSARPICAKPQLQQPAASGVC